MQRRADKFTGSSANADDQGIVHGPRGMRWATFHRLMDRANNLAGEANAAFALGAMRWLRLL
jgi:hypothetical protein